MSSFFHQLIEKTKRVLKSLYFGILECEVYVKYLFWRIFWGYYPQPQEIPIIINNFNRLEMLKSLISSLEKRGFYNISILDNNSTYPPLLEYYKTIKHNVIYLNKNYGYLALWQVPNLYNKYKRSFYVYTDPDVMLDEDCPNDFMDLFLSIMRKYPACKKVGFGIRIDDLPDHYREKDNVIRWEQQHWAHSQESNLFRARIDTTFALYRPFCKGGHSSHLVFRTGWPYVIKHLPWYQDSDHLSEEDRYYTANAVKSTMWTNKAQ